MKECENCKMFLVNQNLTLQVEQLKQANTRHKKHIKNLGRRIGEMQEEMNHLRKPRYKNTRQKTRKMHNHR